MSSKDKLVIHLLSQPKDFRYEDLVTLMRHVGYREYPSQSGSRVRFMNAAGRAYTIHKPHGRENALLDYQIKGVIDFLKGDDSL